MFCEKAISSGGLLVVVTKPSKVTELAQEGQMELIHIIYCRRF
jgi:hypothetical protein